MLEYCSRNQFSGSVFVCLENRIADKETIEILPGLEGEVLVSGQAKSPGRSYLPVVACIPCRSIKEYAQRIKKEKP